MLEQAEHFIKPIVDAAFTPEKVKLVYIKKIKFKEYAKKIAPIIFWKDPDILISIVDNDIEYPLVLLEISTAVFTKDHELQRFDGMLAAVSNKTIYAKLSPIHKESDRKMAGDTKFDYHKPYALVYKDPEFDGAVPEHFDLPVVKNELTKKKSYVEKEEGFVSCPKPIPEFEEFLTTIIKTNISSFDKDDWLEKTRIELEKFPCRLAWTKTLECTKLEDIRTNNSARTRWEKSSGHLLLKINRFGHAMDPERGMLAYFFTFKDNKNQKARMWFWT